MERIGEEISRELARGGSRDALPLAKITAVWSDTVGTAIARNAWPLRIARDRTLLVATESATWSHELDLLRGEILEQLRARLGDDAPAGLRFAVGPVPEPPAPSEARAVAERIEVPPEIESEARSAAATIEDAELRELVARAARVSLVKARSGRRFW